MFNRFEKKGYHGLLDKNMPHKKSTLEQKNQNLILNALKKALADLSLQGIVKNGRKKTI